MFFTHIARAVAMLAFVFGILQIVGGFGAASGILMEDPTLPFREPTGKTIDRGFYMVLFALALGTLAEIGLSVKRLHDPDRQ